MICLKKSKHLIGDRIRQSREVLGMTQQELAEKMSVSQAMVSKWEGHGVAKVNTICKLAEALSVHPIWLAFGYDVSPSS